MFSVQSFFNSMLSITVVDSITITPTGSQSVLSGASSVTLTITANGPWTLEVSDGYLSPNVSSGSGNGSVIVSWAANVTKFCIYDSITFTCGTAAAAYGWSQRGTIETSCV